MNDERIAVDAATLNKLSTVWMGGARLTHDQEESLLNIGETFAAKILELQKLLDLAEKTATAQENLRKQIGEEVFLLRATNSMLLNELHGYDGAWERALAVLWAREELSAIELLEALPLSERPIPQPKTVTTKIKREDFTPENVAEVFARDDEISHPHDLDRLLVLRLKLGSRAHSDNLWTCNWCPDGQRHVRYDAFSLLKHARKDHSQQWWKGKA